MESNTDPAAAIRAQFAKDIDFILDSTRHPKNEHWRNKIANGLTRAFNMSKQRGGDIDRPEKTAMYKVAKCLKGCSSYGLFRTRIIEAFPLQQQEQKPYNVLDRFGVDWKASFKIPEDELARSSKRKKENKTAQIEKELEQHMIDNAASLEEKEPLSPRTSNFEFVEPKEEIPDGIIKILTDKIEALEKGISTIKKNLGAHRHLDGDVVVVTRL